MVRHCKDLKSTMDEENDNTCLTCAPPPLIPASSAGVFLGKNHCNIFIVGFDHENKSQVTRWIELWIEQNLNNSSVGCGIGYERNQEEIGEYK